MPVPVPVSPVIDEKYPEVASPATVLAKSGPSGRFVSLDPSPTKNSLVVVPVTVSGPFIVALPPKILKLPYGFRLSNEIVSYPNLLAGIVVSRLAGSILVSCEPLPIKDPA